MIKDDRLSGAQFIDITLENLPHEDSPSVLMMILERCLPKVFSDMIPVNMLKTLKSKTFNIITDNLLHKFASDIAMINFILECLPCYANDDLQYELLQKMFESNKLFTSKGENIMEYNLSNKHRNMFVRAVCCA